MNAIFPPEFNARLLEADPKASVPVGQAADDAVADGDDREGRGWIDARSIGFAIVGTATFFGIAIACLLLSRVDVVLATIWLPNACAVALLLTARLRHEYPVYIGVATAGIAAQVAIGNPALAGVLHAFANLADVAIVTWMTRRFCGKQPDMTDVGQIAWFSLAGGFVGPAVFAVMANAAVLIDPNPEGIGVWGWFFADSMGMILVVPAILLSCDAWRTRVDLDPQRVARRAGLLVAGLIGVFAIFQQHGYPLLFFAPPIVMLVAFRLGPLGTSLLLLALAFMGTWMTYIGKGPIVVTAHTGIERLMLVQSFVLVNFLCGLPIAAILHARAEMAAALVRESRELSMLADSITDAVIRIDRKGVATYASRSLRDVLDRDPQSFIGERMLDTVHEVDRATIDAAIKRLLRGKSDRERLTYRRWIDGASGMPVYIEAYCAATHSDADGQDTGGSGAAPDGIIASARDVTVRVELEQLLTRARHKAEDAARAKSEFLANMSHEIRTPMNGVLGFAELMLQDDLSDSHRRHVEMIVQSGRSMMLILNDILDLSKIEAGQITVQSAPVDLAMTVNECAGLHRFNARSKGVDLTVRSIVPRCPDNEPGDGLSERGSRPIVVTDALRLRQILLNLIGNAVKFTEKGRIEVCYWAKDVEFGIEVRDTGIGISPSRLESIFSPFTQAESDTARRFGGTGLGLAISRQLALLLDGSIEADSVPGEGSCFRLLLPTTYVAGHKLDDIITAPPESARLPQRSRILLVEDHDVNRILATEMLTRCGQDVAIAHDGHEAISMIMDSVMRGDIYDLVLMDIQMPGCDGYSATRAIRAEGIDPETLPILALTANAFPEDIAAARDAGMQAHLAKPLVFAELVRALQRWLPTRIVAGGQASTMAIASDNAPQLVDRPAAGHGISHAMPAHCPSVGPRMGAQPPHRGVGPQSRADLATATPPQSRALAQRWTQRRNEAMEQLQDALAQGTLGEDGKPECREELARTMHKLAGTAASFGEPELGKQAASLERALKTAGVGNACEAIAFELLTIADNPVDRRSPA